MTNSIITAVLIASLWVIVIHNYWNYIAKWFGIKTKGIVEAQDSNGFVDSSIISRNISQEKENSTKDSKDSTEENIEKVTRVNIEKFLENKYENSYKYGMGAKVITNEDMEDFNQRKERFIDIDSIKEFQESSIDDNQDNELDESE